MEYAAGRFSIGFPEEQKIPSTKTAPPKTGGAALFLYADAGSANDAVLLHHIAELFDHIGCHGGEFVGGAAVALDLMDLRLDIIGSFYHNGGIVDLIFNAKHNNGLPDLL
jgi:hypothetical protein